jgi:copper resistance protein B
MIRTSLALAAALLLATPAAAQDHSMHDMSGMTMPAPAPAEAPATDHSQMDHGTMLGMDMGGDHAGHDMSAMGDMPKAGTDLPPGNTPAPRPPMPHLADGYWDPAAMARSRGVMMQDEGGGRRFAQIMVNLAEAQVRNGRDGYRWDGEGWFGGDIDRLVIKSEGEGSDKLESAEIQALYSRAIDPYFNLQAGVRHDIRPTPDRSYATIGVEGLAPYWFEVEAAAFLSAKGDLLGRVEASYDQRITQRLILQPRAELNLSAQRIPATGLGTGLTNAELGLRLRYEIAREFAPYVGVSWDRKLGQTARLARAAGDTPGGFAFVAGIRTWF